MVQARALRVCMVTGFRPTPGGGGTEKHVYELACGLMDRGIEVEVICEDRSFLPDRQNRLADRIVGVDPDSLHDPEWVPRYLEKSRRFADLLDTSRYDLIHCHSHYGYHVALKLARAAKRPPLISTFHLTPLGELERRQELGFPEPEGAPIDRAVAIMEETLAQLSDRCIAVSRGVADEVNRFYGVAEERVETIYNWFDADVFWPRGHEESRRQLGLDPNRRYLVYVGHFELLRGEILLEAVRRLPDEVTLIAIHPESDPDVQAELGDRVLFPGYQAPDRMAVYYSAADLQCFPTPYGAFGLVLVEGMACGLPPVVFDYSAMNEIVTPACGYRVPEATPEAYAAAIEDALSDAGTKRDAAVQRSKAFLKDPQIDKVVDLYGRVIAGAKIDTSGLMVERVPVLQPRPRAVTADS